MTQYQTVVPPPMDSPSKQLLLELIRDLEKVRVFDDDLKKVHAYERKSYYEKLDRVDREREAIHAAALDEAEAAHNRVREEAETTLKDHLHKEEEERLRKEAAIRKEKERIEREKAEKERIEREVAARAEAERKAKEQAAQKAKQEADAKAAEAERARKAAQDEKVREERELADAKKCKEAEDAQKAQQEAEKQAQSQQQKSLGAGDLSQKEIQIHQRYVELDKTLKEMREWLENMAKSEPSLKKVVGDTRRSLTATFGQTRDRPGGNKPQVEKIKTLMGNLVDLPQQPTLDITKFLAFPSQELINNGDQAPAMLIYCLKMFTDLWFSQLVKDENKTAEPLGIMAAQIFSFEKFTFKGLHLSDILLARYHVGCPVLWGFNDTGPTEDENDNDHTRRMVAMGGGYAALTLRNFGKSPRHNPFPNALFWTSMSKILSILPANLQATHLILLEALLHSSGERIIKFFGHHGLALMHYAMVVLPPQIQGKDSALRNLPILKEMYLKEQNIVI